MRLLRRRHDDDDGLGRVRRGPQGRPAACAQGQHLPLHRLPLDRRCPARQEEHRGRRRRQGAGRQPAQPVHRRHPDGQGALHDGHRDRGHAAPQGAALAACPCAPQEDRQEQGARRPRRGRRLHLGGRAAPALQHGAARGPSGRPRRHLHARQRRPLRRPAARRGDRRERGGGRGRRARPRHRLRDPADGVRSRGRHGTRRADPPRQERGRHRQRQHLLHPAGRDRRRGEGLQGSRRRPREHLLDLARAARPSRDPRLDRLQGQGRPLARPHQLAGPVLGPHQARLPDGRARQPRSTSSPSVSAAASAASRRWCRKTCRCSPA